MPKIIPYQAKQEPPVQIGVVPDPGQLSTGADHLFQRRKAVYAEVGYEVVQPVMPIPNPLILGVGTVQAPHEARQKRRQQIPSDMAHAPSPAGATPPLGNQSPMPLEVPRTKPKRDYAESAHVVNPVPYLSELPPQEMSPLQVRKPRLWEDGISQPPWGTTNWVRLDGWQQLAALPAQRRRIPGNACDHAPSLLSWLPVPHGSLPEFHKPKRVLTTEAHAGPLILIANVPVTYADFWAPIPEPRHRRRVTVPVESMANFAAMLPTHVEQWGQLALQPVAKRVSPWPVEQALVSPLVTVPLTVMDLIGVATKSRRPVSPVDAHFGPPASSSTPFISHVWLDLPRPAGRVTGPPSLGEYPLWVRSAPAGLVYAMLPEVASGSAQMQSATAWWDWTVAVPWTVITGLPDPNVCFDQVLLTTPPAAPAHSAYSVGTIAQLPASITRDGRVYDLTGTTVSVVFTRPDRTTFTRTATVYNAPAGLAYYTTTALDLDMAGIWSRQWQVVDGSTTWSDAAVQFFVQRTTVPWGFSGEWRLIDGLEPLRLTNPDGRSLCVDFALRREARETLSISGESEISVTTCRWHVWRDHLGAFVPQPHGYATDQYASQWYITDVDLQTARSRYVLTSILQAGKGVR